VAASTVTSSRRAVLLALLEGNTRFVLGMVSVVILARLLTPAEIGVFSIGYGFAALAHIFRELGVNAYVIQERELTRERLRAAFAVSLGMAWIVAGILAIGSTWIAQFYRIDELRPIVLLLAANFILVPFGSITLTVLRRDLEFTKLFVINLTSMVFGTAVTIGLAAAGVGAISMAWGSTVTLAVTVAICALMRPSSVPTLPGLGEVQRVLSFGVWTAGGSAIGQAGISAPDMIIGRVLGATETGLFSKAYGIVDTFNRLVLQAIHTFSTPHFSSRIRAGLEVRETYLHAVSLITGLAWPFFTIAAVCTAPLVHVMLGDQWDAAIPVARVLCASAAVSAAFAPFPNLLIAAWGAKAYGSYISLAALVRIIAVLATAWLGLEAVGYGLIAASLAAAFAAMRSLEGRISIAAGDLWRAVRQSLTLSLFALAGAAPSVWLLAHGAAWVQLLVSLVLAGLGWLLGIVLLRHPLWGEIKSASSPALRWVAGRKRGRTIE
jgi:O-antigen/teichoic acid export membrane protein